jgi:hypothetical protein
MAKITKTQFENWSKDFKKKLDEYLDSNRPNLTPEDIVQVTSVFSHIINGVKKQIPLAVMVFIQTSEAFPNYDLIKNKVYSDTDGLTLQQWLDNLKQKLKEHTEADGYYKPSEPVDKSALKQSWKNLWELTKKPGWGIKLKPYLSEEDSDQIIETKVFLEQIMENAGTDGDIGDIKESSEILSKYPFLVKDLIGRVEKAQAKLAEAEKNQKDKGNVNNNPQDSNKLKWGVGLGVTAFIILGIFLLLISQKKKKKKTDYY